MDVPVDDRDALGRIGASGDGDAVHEAEAHLATRKRVMPGRPNDREPAAPRRLDGRARREQSRLERRLGRDRALVEPHRAVERPEELQVRARVTEKRLIEGGGLRPHEVRERGVQRLDAVDGLRVAEGGVEARERLVAYELDCVTAAASSSSGRSPCARPTR
jgi:hypothetical protein